MRFARRSTIAFRYTVLMGGASAEEHYMFGHALVRDAAYQLLMPTDRAGLHAMAVDVLRGAFDDITEIAAEIADHASLARQVPLAASTAYALERAELEMLHVAAAYAQGSYQNEQAAVLLSRLASHSLTTPVQVCRALEQLAMVHARRAQLDAEHAALQQLASHPQCMLRQRVWAISRLASNAKQLGRPQECWSLLDAAESLARQSDDRQALAQVLQTRGANLITGGNLDSAVDFTQRGLDLALTSGAFDVALDALENLVILHRHRSEFENALACLVRMEQLVQDGRVGAPADRWANSRGNIYWRMGRLDEAESCYRTALDTARRQGNIADAATAQGNLGNIHLGRGDDRGALQLFALAARECAEAGLVNHHALWVNNVGNSHFYAGELDLALDAYRRAEALHGQAGDRNAQSSVVANIGLVLQEQGHTEDALQHYRLAESIARDSGATVAVSSHVFRQSELMRLQQRPAQALALLLQSLDLRLECGPLLPPEGVAYQVDIARLNLALGDGQAARQALDAAGQFAQAVQASGQPVRNSVKERIAMIPELQDLAANTA